MKAFWRVVVALNFCWAACVFAQQSATPAATAPAGSPPAVSTSPASAPAAAAGEGSVQLDVVVTDQAGKPVAGLDLNDFTLIEDNRPQKIVSLHTMDATIQRTVAPTHVILMLDTVNLGFEQAAFARTEMEKFLRQNNGHMALPVSVFVLTADGVNVMQPTADGNEFADRLEHLGTALRKADVTTGAGADIARYQLSLKWLTAVARNVASRPGKKLLIWSGPGWPSLDGPNYTISDKMLQGDFNLLVELSTLLRVGQISVYDVTAAENTSAKSGSMGGASESTTTTGTSKGGKSAGFGWAEMDYNANAGPFAYKNFLKGVKTADKAAPPYLGLKVLAIQGGGLVLGPGNNLLEQINQCVQDASVYYRLSFAPSHSNRANDYHDLKVQVGRPGLTARTNTGFYGQP